MQILYNTTMEPIIEVKNISKTYTIRHQLGSYVTLRDVLGNILRHPFKFLRKKVGEVTGTESKEIFWALKDVSFSIYPGEVVGIIGSNGAGKSTLLKILSKITPPSAGEVIVRGNMASLLEVGTGFHPELTGRENIFLNGAILGMGRKEIAHKFDEIVEFSGVGQFLDTPVKYYSSGMYVRLAFAVAAHMEPDILVVDEVLAVGDADFQKKSLGKMEEVTKSAGRTILFVSHNMSAVLNLCKRSILLEKGQIKMIGETRDVVNHYLNLDGSAEEKAKEATTEFELDPSKTIQTRKISILNTQGNLSPEIPINESFDVLVEYTVLKETDGVLGSIIFFGPAGQRILDSYDDDTNPDSFETRKPGTYRVTLHVPDIFNANTYNIMVVFGRGTVTLDVAESAQFRVVETSPRSYNVRDRAPIIPKLDWKMEEI